MQTNCTTNHLESPPHARLAFGGNLEEWQKKILADSTGIIPYTAKNDYMFKAICQTNTYALKGLLSALLGMRMEEIREIDILNPIQLGETVHEKDCILDVKLKLNNNRIINIELQVALQPDWPECSLDYLCNAVTMQVKSGAPYGSFLSTIHIGILDFDLFPDHKEFNSLYYLTDAKTRHIYTGKFALAVVNLKQINRATEEDIASGLRDWARLFQAAMRKVPLMQNLCKRQVLSSKKWNLFSSTFWQIKSSTFAYSTPRKIRGIFLTKWKFLD